MIAKSRHGRNSPFPVCLAAGTLSDMLKEHNVVERHICLKFNRDRNNTVVLFTVNTESRIATNLYLTARYFSWHSAGFCYRNKAKDH
jgi:hypothetical protein